MIEARVFTDSIEPAKAVLESSKAELQGYYEIQDMIFRNADPQVSLTDEFLRLREVPVNIWPDKRVILALKRTNVLSIGKESEIPLKLEFNEKKEAEEYYQQNLADKYTYDFSFSRVGWQYFLPNGDVVDLEVIEDLYPTIEFKSKTDDGVAKLIEKFDVTKEKIITGPSVVATRKILIPS